MIPIRHFIESYRRVQEDEQRIEIQSVIRGANLGTDEKLHALARTFQGKQLWLNILSVFKRDLILFAFVGVLLAFLTPALPLAMESVFTSLDRHGAIPAEVARSALVVTVVVLARLALTWYQSWREDRLLLQVFQLMSRLLFLRLQHIDVNLLREQGKAPFSYVTTYANQLTQVIYLVDFAVTTLTIIALIVSLLFQFGAAAFAILGVLAVLIGLMQWIITAIGQIYYTYLGADQARVNLIERAISDFPSIKRQYLEPQLLSALTQVREQQVAILKRRSISQIASHTLDANLIPLMSLAVLGVALYANNLASSAEALSILVLLGFLLQAVQNNLSNFRVLRFTLEPTREVERLFQDYPPVLDEHSSSPETFLLPGQVQLSHPTDSRRVILEPGSRVAVVGRTGTGKSTLLKQLAGQRDGVNTQFPCSVGGVAVLVERNEALFDGEIAELITLWQRPVVEDRYAEALIASGLVSDLASHPEGDARWVRAEDKSLSEGQIQRLSLARALYFSPDVLLLDDVFAPMNPELAQNVATHILSSRPAQPTVIFATSRLDMVQHADQVLLLGHDDFLLLSSAEVLDHTQETSVERLLGKDLADRLRAALRSAELEFNVQAPQFDQADSARKYVFGEQAPPPPRSTFDTEEVQTLRLGDLIRNALGIYPAWGLLALAFSSATFLLTAMLFASLIERWQSTSGTDLFVLLLITVGVGVIAQLIHYTLTYRLPIASIDRLHRLFGYRLIGDRASETGDKAAFRIGRLTEDFSDLELEQPNDMASLNTAVLDALLYVGFLVLVINPITLLIIAPITLIAWRGYLRGKAIVAAASRLRASVRGPMFGFVGPALGSAGYRLSAPLRKALFQRFSTLADLQVAGSYWSVLARARVYLFVQGLGVALFLCVLWMLAIIGMLDLPIALGLAPSVILFLVFAFSQRVAGLVGQLQYSEASLTQFERLAALLGRRSLPSQQEAAKVDFVKPLDFYRELLVEDRDSVAAFPSSILVARDLTHSYLDGRPLFTDFSLSARTGHCLAVVGPSGVGKSTLARLLAGALHSSHGTIQICGKTPDNHSANTRQCLWYLESNVPPLSLTCYDFLDPAKSYDLEQLPCVFDTLDEDIEAWRSRMSSSIDALSLGQRQVLNLARAVIARPRILILDEATSGLDSTHERRVLSKLQVALPDTVILAILHRPDNLDLFRETIFLNQAMPKNGHE